MGASAMGVYKCYFRYRLTGIESMNAAELAHSLEMCEVCEGKLIDAVRRSDLHAVELLFNENPDLDPMKCPKTGGDCAVMKGIETENLAILDILLTRTPQWVGQDGKDLAQLVARGILQGKLYALACIMRRKGYPHVTGFSPEFDYIDYSMGVAEWNRIEGAKYLLGLEKYNPWYFRDRWGDIKCLIAHARKL